jgi:hypothetical protein
MATAYHRWGIEYLGCDDKMGELACWRKTRDEAMTFAKEVLAEDGLEWKAIYVRQLADDPITVQW